MKFEDIKGFNLRDDYFAVCTYLTMDLIEEFDYLNILDKVIKLYKTEPLDLPTLEPYYNKFGDLYSDISKEAVNMCNVEEIWGLCTIIDTKTLIKASNNICANKIDDFITNVIAFALVELINYKPVSDFLNMELAMTIYGHVHGQIAQFPYKSMKEHIAEFTYPKHSVKSFVEVVAKEI